MTLLNFQLRASTETRIHTVGEWVAKLTIGALLFAAGVWFMIADYRVALAAKEQVHLSHIAAFGGTALLGMLVPFAPFMLPVAQKVVVIISNLPFVPGGKRASDPPLDGSSKP